jgi:ankyrin repeat protein
MAVTESARKARDAASTDGAAAGPGATRRADRRLCDAASSGDATATRDLLASGADPDSAYGDGTTALMAASFSGALEVVRELLAGGADPNLQDESGLSALMNAVIAAAEMELEGARPIFVEVAEALIAAGADPELEDENGQTAADIATENDLVEFAHIVEG